MATVQTVGAISSEAAEWFAIDWPSVYRNVRRLQVRIVKAMKENRWNKVKALQRLLTHSYSGKVLAVRRVTENNGKRTPGLLKEKFPTKKPLSSFGGKFACVNLIRYADDFIITGRTKELLEGEIKPLVEQFLQERGLELSPAKTVITHVEKGFDFLGQNVRKYPNGKVLIKPSKKNVKTFLGGIRKIIRAARGMSAADLIRELNPKIRGWANYHRHVVSSRTFARVDHEIFSSLWRWARRRHPNKNTRWRKQKYFVRHRGRDWSFFGETCDDEGQPSQVWLYHARSIPIKRHVKVKGDANPYDPAYETYFEQREEAHMQDTFRGTRTLRFLWQEQRGLCTLCNTKITRLTGWRLHHCVPRVMGGSRSAENRVPLHPVCHDRVHRQHLSVSKPRLPRKRRSKGLSCVRGNFHAQFLEGWTGAIPSGYSVMHPLRSP